MIVSGCMAASNRCFAGCKTGAGVVPRSGELGHLWWRFEKGEIGDPSPMSVKSFRDLLLGEDTIGYDRVG